MDSSPTQHRRPMSRIPEPEQLEAEAARMIRKATRFVGWISYPGLRGDWSEVLRYEHFARLCGYELNYPTERVAASIVPLVVIEEADRLSTVAARLRQQRAHDSVMATIKLDRTLTAIEREAHHLIDCGRGAA